MVEIFHAGAGNFVAHDGDFDRLVPSLAAERNVNGGSFRAFQHVRNLRRGQTRRSLLPSTFGMMSPGRIPALKAGESMKGACTTVWFSRCATTIPTP